MRLKRWIWLALSLALLAACGPDEATDGGVVDSSGAGGGAEPTEAASGGDVTSNPSDAVLEIVNKAGSPICGVYVASSADPEYGDNRLSGELGDGESLTVTLPEPGSYDFAATTCDAPDESFDERIGNNADYGTLVWEIGGEVYVAESAPPPAATDAEQPAASSAGADFAPDRDGFQFENYTTEHTDADLNIDSMRAIFGDDAVCVSVSDGECAPAPNAQMLMEYVNTSMQSGHCFGFTVAAMRMHARDLNPADFDEGVDTVFAVNPDNDIFSQISQDFLLQYTSEFQTQTIRVTPSEAAQGIAELGQPVALSFFSDEGGHSALGYNVEDRGDGIVWIWVYDNNWAGRYTYIEIDTNADTWKYSLAALNPTEDSSAWTGDASTMSLWYTPYSAFAKYPFCFDCIGAPPSANTGGVMARPTMITANTTLVGLNGEGRMLITNEAGQRVGYVDGKYVNEVPGANVQRAFGVTVNRSEPTVFMPQGKFEVKVDPRNARGLNRGEINAIGKDFSFKASGLGMNGQQSSSLSMSPTDRHLSFAPGGQSRPTLKLAVQGDNGKTYVMALGGGSFDEGQTLDMGVDPETGKMVFKGEGLGDEHFSFVMAAVDENGTEIFANSDLALSGEGGAAFDFESWDGGPLEIDVDADGDGEYESSGSLDDEPFDALDETIGSADEFEALFGGFFGYMDESEASEYFSGLEDMGLSQEELDAQMLDVQDDMALTDEEQQALEDDVNTPGDEATEEPDATEAPPDEAPPSDDEPPSDDAPPADDAPPPL